MTAGLAFHRQLPPYVFADVTGLTLAARRQGDDIKDPDLLQGPVP
ncbi:MAG: hypothetical protein WD448_11625 [Woeseia sp.]